MRFISRERLFQMRKLLTGAVDAGKDLECKRLFSCAVEKYGMSEALFIQEPNARNSCQNFEFSKRVIEDLGG